MSPRSDHDDQIAATGRGLTIDCGEGKHDVCCGFGTSSYLIPQTAGERFECACPCHEQPAATGKGVVLFEEYGTHKTIGAVHGPVSGTIRVSDQATIDYLREAFEKAGWEVEDRVH